LRIVRARQVFDELYPAFGLARDKYTYTHMVGLYCWTKRLDEAKKIYEMAINDLGGMSKIDPDMAGMLIDGLARKERFDEAFEVLIDLKKHDHFIKESYVRLLRFRTHVAKVEPPVLGLIPADQAAWRSPALIKKHHKRARATRENRLSKQKIRHAVLEPHWA
jgi:pentatricopeptide repeat protein